MLGCCSPAPDVAKTGDGRNLRELLVEKGRSKLSFIETRAAQIKPDPTPEEARSISEYIRQHPDYTSYIGLLYLRAKNAEAYRSIDSPIKASVLASALANLKWLNDWGCLYPSPYDSDSAKELVGLGSAAVDPLIPLLSDKRRAYLGDFGGSEWSSNSNRFEFRICDYAYRYVGRIKNLEPTFKVSIPERDRQIEELRGKLSGR